MRAERSWMERAAPRLPGVFAALALLSAVLLLVFMPPFLVSDEDAHSRRADTIAHGNWLAERVGRRIGAPVDTNLAGVANVFIGFEERAEALYPVAATRPDGRIPLSALLEQGQVYWSHQREFVAFPNSATYPPTLYLTQVLGWRLGEAFDLSIVHSLLFVRLLTALCSIAVGWFALRIGRLNPWLLSAYLLLPTVLGLAASCSQDALLVTVAALAAALVSRATAERRTFSMREWILAMMLFASLVMARPPYLPLTLVLLLPPLQAAGARGWRRYRGAVVAIALVAGALLAWQAAAPATSSYDGLIAGVDPKLQLAFLRSHPLRGTWTVVGGTLSLAPHLLVKALYSLGWNDIYPSNAVYGVMILSLACLCLCSTWQGLNGWRPRGLVLLGVVASILAISLAEYLIWTPVGAPKLDGPLPRYYLPLIPFLLLFSSEKPRRWTSRAGLGWIPMASIAVLIFMVFTPPWLLSHRFYNTGPMAVLRATLK